MKMKFFALFLLLTFVQGCSFLKNVMPDWHDETNQESQIVQEQQTVDSSLLPVNPYLWQATLDKLSFMPLASSDAKGGVIITDWKSMSGVPDEQFKVNVAIHTRVLRVDGLKVEVFERKFVDGKWTDAHNNSQLANELEKAILYRARELFRSDVISR